MYQQNPNFPRMSGNPYEQNAAVVKNYFKRPIVLALAIVSALSWLLSVVSNIFMSNGGMQNVIYTILNQMYVNGMIDGSTYSQVIESLGASSVAFSMSFIPQLLISLLGVAALFIIYFKSKNPDPMSKPTAGFTINWVFAIISLVLSIIIAVFLAIMLVFVFIILLNYGEESTAGIVGVALFFTFAISMGLMIFYSASEVRYWSSARKSINGLTLTAKGASAYGVFCIIFAITSLFSIFNSIANYRQWGISGILPIIGIFSTITGGVGSLLSGIVALGYKNLIKRHNTFEPFSGMPPYNGAPNRPIGYSYDPIAEQNNGYNAQPYTPVQPQTPQNFEQTAPLSEQWQDNADNAADTDSVISDGEVRMDTSAIDESENPFEPQQTVPVMNTPPAENAPVQSPSICPRCGAPANPDYIFCNKCGYKLR